MNTINKRLYAIYANDVRALGSKYEPSVEAPFPTIDTASGPRKIQLFNV